MRDSVIDRVAQALYNQRNQLELKLPADPLSNQLDLFDQELNRIKAVYWNSRCLKYLHYGKEKNDTEVATQKTSYETTARFGV